MARMLLGVCVLLGFTGVVRLESIPSDVLMNVLSSLEEKLELRGKEAVGSENTGQEQEELDEELEQEEARAYQQRSASTFPQPSVSDLEGGVWQMVFRAQSGNGQNVYDAWKSGSGVSTTKPIYTGRSYSKHYRDPLVSQWSSLGVQQVKFALYFEGREVAYIIFNGHDSNYLNWFSKERVIASSYSDLTAYGNYNYFSIEGHPRANYHYRRFFVNKLYNGCPKDLGWIDVADIGTVSPCHMDFHAVLPQFLYSTINGADYWERGMYGRADFMAVFVRSF